MRSSITPLNHLIGHPRGHGRLLCKFLLCLYYRIIDLVITFNFDDDVGAVFFLEEEVGIVGADGVGFGVDVLDVEVGLAVGEHAGEVEFYDTAVAEEIPEELLFRGGVEAVDVEVEGFGRRGPDQLSRRTGYEFGLRALTW